MQWFIVELLRTEGMRVEPHTLENLVTHRSQKFWLVPWLYVHMYVCMYVRTPNPIPWKMRVAPLPWVHHWHSTSMLRLIDSCQSRVFTDQYHVTMSWAQVESYSRSRVFSKLTAGQAMGFLLDCGLKPGINSKGEWGRACKGKISAKLEFWLVIDFSSVIFLGKSWKVLDILRT